MISAQDYAFVAQLLLAGTGLHVGYGKEYLIESRLRPVATAYGHGTVAELLASLRVSRTPEIVRELCEAMATHESSFFRDGVPFDLLRTTVLPELIRLRGAQRSLRIWCAAASTGQEPYSVAMLLDDMPISDWNVEIVATDYSRPALDRAAAGVFNGFEVHRGLSAEQRTRFLTPHGSGFQIRRSTRERVRFAEVNLIHSFGNLGTFDLILCRNVLIYFDVAVRKDVLERMANTLAPDGYLLLGAAESAIGVTDRLARVADLPTSIYKLGGSAYPALAAY